MATILGLGAGALCAIGAVAVFSPGLRVRLRRSVTPVAVAVIALVLLASYLENQ